MKMGKVSRSQKYTESDITQCLQAIQNRVPIKTACKRYSIPRSTIKFRNSDKFSGKARKGPPTALTAQEESEIVQWIMRMARKGFPITKERLVLTVRKFLAENPRKGNVQMKAGKLLAYLFVYYCNASIIPML